MPDLYQDFVFGSLTASVAVGDTTATLDDVSSFPSNTVIAKADFYVGFDSGLTHPNTFEIVKVTNVNTSSKVITIGAAAYAHPIATYVKGTLTAGMLQRIRAGLSGTTVPAQDNTIYSIGDRFLLTTTNAVYVYTSSGFVPQSGTGRTSSSATTSSLAVNATDSTTTIALSKGFNLYSVQTDRAARVELYETAAAKTADASRPIGGDPVSGSGVLLDYVTSGSAVYPLSPMVVGANLESTPSSNIAMRVTNLSTATSTVTVTLVWLKVE